MHRAYIVSKNANRFFLSIKIDFLLYLNATQYFYGSPYIYPFIAFYQSDLQVGHVFREDSLFFWGRVRARVEGMGDDGGETEWELG